MSARRYQSFRPVDKYLSLSRPHVLCSEWTLRPEHVPQPFPGQVYLYPADSCCPQRGDDAHRDKVLKGNQHVQAMYAHEVARCDAAPYPTEQLGGTYGVDHAAIWDGLEVPGRFRHVIDAAKVRSGHAPPLLSEPPDGALEPRCGRDGLGSGRTLGPSDPARVYILSVHLFRASSRGISAPCRTRPRMRLSPGNCGHPRER